MGTSKGKTKYRGEGEYQCVQLCGASYQSIRGLARHQGSCKILTQDVGVNLAEAEQSRETAKRRRLEVDQAMAAAGVDIVMQERTDCSSSRISDHSLEGLEPTMSGPTPVESIITAQTVQACIARYQMPDSASNTEESRPSASSIVQNATATTADSLEPPVHLQEELGRGKRKKTAVQRYVAQRYTNKRKPRKYNDPKPDPPPPIPEHDTEILSTGQHPTQAAALNSTESGPSTSIISSPSHQTCRTEKNSHGLYREYYSRPSFVPDETIREDLPVEDDEDMSEPLNGPIPTVLLENSIPVREEHAVEQPRSWFWPFLSATTFRIMNWFWNGSQQKSVNDLQTLVDEVLLANDFDISDLRKFNAKRESGRLDALYNDEARPKNDDVRMDTALPAKKTLLGQDGWRTVSVKISLPDRVPRSSEVEAPKFTVSGLYYRPLVNVIQSAFQNQDGLRYHYMPFKQFWCPPSDSRVDVARSGETDSADESFEIHQHRRPSQRVYDELYSSDAWYKAHGKLQENRIPGDEYENAIAALMMWSDSTQLAQFGTASLWPVYVYFGNQSKYERCRPNANACHHLAYIPELPDSISEAFRKLGENSKKPTYETLTHCRRDLMHALLAVLFDDEFKTAYREGIIIACADGIKRRLFPRIFTWSADYPEKVLLSSIFYLSDYPCPRCLIPKTRTHELGVNDVNLDVERHARIDTRQRQSIIASARERIYKYGRGVKSTAVMAVLGGQSLAPIFNTLSNLLLPFGINFYELFVVDFLHEFELGVWKNTFIQLIQIIADGVPDGLSKLNERYRLIPTFGSDVIRKFTDDASAMTKLGARDFEDLLICALPVFEGLLPEEHNDIVMDLLFSLATWHGLGKLRMHTEETIDLLDHATRLLGVQLRLFKDVTCQAFETEELKAARKEKEKQRAIRKKNRKSITRSKSKILPKGKTPDKDQSKRKKKAKPRKKFCLNNYKTHALNHYVQNIRAYGAVDSYSTQSGELEHRRVKKYYARTNKHNAVEQITRIERREHVLRDIAREDPTRKTDPPSNGDAVPFTRCDQHHHISSSRENHFFLPAWLRNHEGDPAVHDFRNKLKDHLLRCLLGKDFDGDEEESTEEERNTVQIEYNRLFIHKVIRVNHTTYDLRRNQDSMNPRTHSDVMVLAPKYVYKGKDSDDDDDDYQDEKHPFWYAQIVGIYHANIRHSGSQSKTQGIPQRMEFLWVRWFGQASNIPSGWAVRRLHAVQFVPKWNGGAFGFVDPSQVVRGIHLIPAFHYGRALARLTNSVACKEGEDEWECYYVNSFVDRDMLMRFAGGGVGHAQMNLVSTGNLQPLTFADLQPGVGAIKRDVIALASNHTTTLQQKEVDEENDEVRSMHADEEDSDSSTDYDRE